MRSFQYTAGISATNTNDLIRSLSAARENMRTKCRAVMRRYARLLRSAHNRELQKLRDTKEREEQKVQQIFETLLGRLREEFVNRIQDRIAKELNGGFFSEEPAIAEFVTRVLQRELETLSGHGAQRITVHSSFPKDILSVLIGMVQAEHRFDNSLTSSTCIIDYQFGKISLDAHELFHDISSALVTNTDIPCEYSSVKDR